MQMQHEIFNLISLILFLLFVIRIVLIFLLCASFMIHFALQRPLQRPLFYILQIKEQDLIYSNTFS